MYSLIDLIRISRRNFCFKISLLSRILNDKQYPFISLEKDVFLLNITTVAKLRRQAPKLRN